MVWLDLEKIKTKIVKKFQVKFFYFQNKSNFSGKLPKIFCTNFPKFNCPEI